MLSTVAAITAALFASAKDLVSKRVSVEVDGNVSAFASFLFALPFYFVLLATLYLLGLERFAWGAAFGGLVLARSSSDSLAEWSKMQALSHGDLSLVTLFFSLSPLFLVFLSPLITGDPISSFNVLAVLITVAGSILLVYRPGVSFRGAERKAVLFAFGGSLFFAINQCVDRLAVQQASPALAAFSMTLVSCLMLSPTLRFTKKPLGQLVNSQKFFWGRGLLEVCFMVTKLFALQFMSAPQMSVLIRLNVLFSVIGGRILFDERQTFRRLMAALLIIGGAAIVVFFDR